VKKLQQALPDCGIHYDHPPVHIDFSGQ